MRLFVEGVLVATAVHWMVKKIAHWVWEIDLYSFPKLNKFYYHSFKNSTMHNIWTKFYLGFFQHELYANILNQLLLKIFNFVSFALYDKSLFKWVSRTWYMYMTYVLKKIHYNFLTSTILMLFISYFIWLIILALLINN